MTQTVNTAFKTEYDKLFIGGKWVEPWRATNSAAATTDRCRSINPRKYRRASPSQQAFEGRAVPAIGYSAPQLRAWSSPAEARQEALRPDFAGIP